MYNIYIYICIFVDFITNKILPLTSYTVYDSFLCSKIVHFVRPIDEYGSVILRRLYGDLQLNARESSSQIPPL